MGTPTATKLLALLTEAGEGAELTTNPSDHQALFDAGVMEAASYSGHIRNRLDTILESVSVYHPDDHESDFDQLQQLVDGYRELSLLLSEAKTVYNAAGEVQGSIWG